MHRSSFFITSISRWLRRFSQLLIKSRQINRYTAARLISQNRNCQSMHITNAVNVLNLLLFVQTERNKVFSIFFSILREITLSLSLWKDAFSNCIAIFLFCHYLNFCCSILMTIFVQFKRKCYFFLFLDFVVPEICVFCLREKRLL